MASKIFKMGFMQMLAATLMASLRYKAETPTPNKFFTVGLFKNHRGEKVTVSRETKFLNRSRYQPHQGKRECARRLARMEVQHG